MHFFSKGFLTEADFSKGFLTKVLIESTKKFFQKIEALYQNSVSYRFFKWSWRIQNSEGLIIRPKLKNKLDFEITSYLKDLELLKAQISKNSIFKVENSILKK